MSVAMSIEWTLGNRIERARNLAGLKQSELALRIGVSRAVISKWERDVSEPTASQIVKIAEACNVHVVALLGLAPITTCFGHPSLSLVEFPPNDAMHLFDPDDFGLEPTKVTLVTTGA